MRTEHAAGLAFVLALHAAVLYGLWAARVIPPPTAAMTLFVNLIEPAPIPPKPSDTPPPRPARPLKSPDCGLIFASNATMVAATWAVCACITGVYPGAIAVG